MGIPFEFNSEECERIFYAAGHLVSGEGRLTAGASMSLDHGWDVMEEVFASVMERALREETRRSWKGHL